MSQDSQSKRVPVFLAPNELPRTYYLVENFDKGTTPPGWGSSTASGGTVTYTQVSESGVTPGLALMTITNAPNSRAALICGNGFQYMRTFTDSIQCQSLNQLRWSGIPSLINSAQIFGWINSNTAANPNLLGNCLGIMYDPSNVSGFNPGLITNLFLLARSNYNGPVANTIVDLGIAFDNINFHEYLIIYDNVLSQVRVYRDNILLTTLLDLSNVPAGSIRGTIPAAAGAGLQEGIYLANGAAAGSTGASLRISQSNVFKQYTA